MSKVQVRKCDLCQEEMANAYWHNEQQGVRRDVCKVCERILNRAYIYGLSLPLEWPQLEPIVITEAELIESIKELQGEDAECATS